MFLETDLDNWESFCLSPHTEVAIKNWKTFFCTVHTSQKLNACCMSHAGNVPVKRTTHKEKTQVHANVIELCACACAKGIRHTTLTKS